MHFSVKGMAFASAAVWGLCMLLVGLINLASPPYGTGFLQLMASVYPGFHGTRALGDALVGTGYGIVDGAAFGAVFAWLYNSCAGPGNRGSANTQ